MNSRKAVAAEIRAAMGRAGFNQTELARKLTMSRASLSDRLSCKRAFDLDDLVEIAAALNVDPLSFLLPHATASSGDAA